MEPTREDDPRGFLERCPGLEPLLTVPAVAAAIRRGNGIDLYRALQQWRKTRHTGPEVPLVDELLRHRRFFLTPVKSAPGLFTLNGVGTTLYGKSEQDPEDGTYIATLFFALVFLPVLPIAQYLVRDAGGNKYEFFGKVPFSGAMRAWQRLVGAGVVALIAAGVISGVLSEVNASRNATLHLVNGLDVPVTISVSDKQVRVAARSRVAHLAPVGPASLSARLPSGRVLEKLDVEVPARKDVVAYSVLGAAPLFAEGIIYSDADRSAENPFNHYAGERFIVRDDVPYVFTDPPKTIQMSKYSSSATRWMFSMVDGGWSTTVAMLLRDGKDDRALELATQVSLAEPENLQARFWTDTLTRKKGGTEALLEYGKKLIEANPDSIDAHRAHQDYLRLNGKLDEARKFYAELREKEPDLPMATYLAARLEPPEQALSLFGELVKKSPDDPHVVRGYAYALFQTRRYGEALPAFEKYVKLDKAMGGFSQEHARTLVAVGRAADAAALLDSQADALPREAKFVHAVLYARVASLAGERAPHPADYYLQRLSGTDPTAKAWFAVRTGQRLTEEQLSAVKDEATRLALRITDLAASDPTEAVRLAAEADDEALEHLDDPVLVLLAGELLRKGDEELTDVLLGQVDWIRPEELKAYLSTGEEPLALREADLELQAALHFARARLLESKGKPGVQLYKTALEEDILQGVVSSAVKRWPKPKKG